MAFFSPTLSSGLASFLTRLQSQQISGVRYLIERYKYNEFSKNKLVKITLFLGYFSLVFGALLARGRTDDFDCPEGSKAKIECSRFRPLAPMSRSVQPNIAVRSGTLPKFMAS